MHKIQGTKGTQLATPPTIAVDPGIEVWGRPPEPTVRQAPGVGPSPIAARDLGRHYAQASSGGSKRDDASAVMLNRGPRRSLGEHAAIKVIPFGHIDGRILPMAYEGHERPDLHCLGLYCLPHPGFFWVVACTTTASRYAGAATFHSTST